MQSLPVREHLTGRQCPKSRCLSFPSLFSLLSMMQYTLQQKFECFSHNIAKERGFWLHMWKTKVILVILFISLQQLSDQFRPNCTKCTKYAERQVLGPHTSVFYFTELWQTSRECYCIDKMHKRWHTELPHSVTARPHSSDQLIPFFRKRTRTHTQEYVCILSCQAGSFKTHFF